MLENVKPYYKFIAQVVATMAVAFVTTVADNEPLSASELFNILAVGLGAVGVLTSGETVSGFWKKAKTYVAGAAAVAVFASSAVSDGSWTTAETAQALIAFLFAIGITIVPGPAVQQLPNVLTGVIRGRHEV
jgi:hypothetical protein